ncbi:RIP metalloprotease RseP [Novosphingobium sp. B 225]|uniref:RIP metalloprotease RseP n=1 Tax=Novosphingobium sp. B 225 TaxID=1961849 RepID=UPI0034E95842
MITSPSILMTIGAFLLVLGPLVLLHELGHYLVARWFGVRSDVFAIGFGKEVAGWTDKRGTRWKLGMLPLGGYVQFSGDANGASVPDPALADASAEQLKGTFQGAPMWQRALIVLAGPLTNLLAAVAVFAVFNMSYGVPTSAPVVDQFAPNSAAQAAGMQVGDRIVAIDGDRIEAFEDVVSHVILYPGHRLSIMVERAGRQVPIAVTIPVVTSTDRFGNKIERGQIGVSARLSFEPVGPVRAVVQGWDQSIGVMKFMVAGLRQIIVGERSVRELGGPIKIAKYSGESLAMGWPAFVSFAALISINLAFINLLPIPGLDGGHLAIYAAETIRRKPLDARSQEWAFRTGLALVLALMLFVTLNDIASLPIFGR